MIRYFITVIHTCFSCILLMIGNQELGPSSFDQGRDSMRLGLVQIFSRFMFCRKVLEVGRRFLKMSGKTKNERGKGNLFSFKLSFLLKNFSSWTQIYLN